MESTEKPESFKDEKSKPEQHSPTPRSSAELTRDAKIAGLWEACKWKDIETLRVLATSEGGLVLDEIRCQAWPILLGCSSPEKSEGGDHDVPSWKTLPKHRDEDQVQLDVDRSFIYYPHDQSSRELDRWKTELSALITEVLRRQPHLSYFQGYHDICQVFLLVLASSSSRSSRSLVPAVARLSALRIRDFMLPTFAQALAQLQLIPAIIHAVSPKLWTHLAGIAPFFALSGTLTMYAHDIQEYGEIARLFDVLLAREAVFSVYIFAQIVLQRSDELFEIPADEPDMLHFILSKLPNPLRIETLIANTVTLIEQHPPETLKIWSSISSNSVLKTARIYQEMRVQTLEDGKAYFEKQKSEIEWADRREKAMKVLWKYRKPARTVGIAVLVGVLAFWLRKSPVISFGVLWRHLGGR